MVKWIHFKTKFEAMIAYLSGAMEFADDEGSGWRKDLTKWLDDNLGHQVYDPVIQSAALIKKYGASDYRNWKNSDPKNMQTLYVFALIMILKQYVIVQIMLFVFGIIMY